VTEVSCEWKLFASRRASRPQVMTRVLGIVYRAIATYLIHKAGFTKPMEQTGAVTLVQRFGGALSLNIHFHLLYVDAVYTVVLMRSRCGFDS